MVNVAIIGTEKSGRTSLAANLGKKGTVSDITMYNNEKEGKNMVFVDAQSYPKTLKSLVTVLNISDIAVLCIPPRAWTPIPGNVSLHWTCSVLNMELLP